MSQSFEHPKQLSPQGALAHLFIELYGDERSLLSFFRDHHGLEELPKVLPSGAGLDTVAHAAVAALEQRGLIDQGLFQSLARDRPFRRKAITRTAQCWHIVVEHSPNPAQLTLRVPPALPPFPNKPFPELDPYEHPDHFGGRQAELEKLLSLLDENRLLYALFAASGAGKSSLIRAGLLPALQGHGGGRREPVAFDRLPAIAGFTRRISEQLVEDAQEVEDDDPEGFANLLSQVRDLAGHPPVILVDQFEDALESRALSWLGPLIAATEVAPLGRAARWVLIYRHEFHGRVVDWLGDVLRHAEHLPLHLRDRLPSRLVDFGVSWAIPVLGDPGGSRAPESSARAAFRDAILRPLQIRGLDGRPHFHFRMTDETVERLSAAFARARLHGRLDPLVPELQVLLARLVEQARTNRDADGISEISFPMEDAEADSAISMALGSHLQRKLEEVALRVNRHNIRAARTEALLILARLVDTSGARRAVHVASFEAGLGRLGKALVEALQGPQTRLIRTDVIEGERYYVLPHDRVAAEIVRLLHSPSEALVFGVDPSTVELWRFVAQRSAAWQGGDALALVLDGTRNRALRRHASAFPWDESTRAWWAAAQGTRRRVQLRQLSVAMAIAFLLSGLGLRLLRETSLHQLEREVHRRKPASGAPLRALYRLQAVHGYSGERLAEVLGQSTADESSFDPSRRDEIFGVGASGLSEEERLRILEALIEGLADQVEHCPEPESFYGALLASTETLEPGDPGLARRLRARIVRAMRTARSLPPPSSDSSGWSDVIRGTFEIGCFESAGDHCQDDEPLRVVNLSPYRIRLKEETVGDYRSFDPDFLVGRGYSDDMPLAEINWYEASAYAAWRGLALPTEAQWEVAARGGSSGDFRKTAFYSGNEAADLSRVGVWAGNLPELSLRSTRPQGEPFRALAALVIDPADRHPLGLEAIHGNQSEWTSEWHQTAPSAEVADPRGPPKAPCVANPARECSRLTRGGDWTAPAVYARSAFRYDNHPSLRDATVGFRTVCLVTDEAPWTCQPATAEVDLGTSPPKGDASAQ